MKGASEYAWDGRESQPPIDAESPRCALEARACYSIEATRAAFFFFFFFFCDASGAAFPVEGVAAAAAAAAPASPPSPALLPAPPLAGAAGGAAATAAGAAALGAAALPPGAAGAASGDDAAAPSSAPPRDTGVERPAASVAAPAAAAAAAVAKDFWAASCTQCEAWFRARRAAPLGQAKTHLLLEAGDLQLELRRLEALGKQAVPHGSGVRVADHHAPPHPPSPPHHVTLALRRAAASAAAAVLTLHQLGEVGSVRPPVPAVRRLLREWADSPVVQPLVVARRHDGVLRRGARARAIAKCRPGDGASSR